MALGLFAAISLTRHTQRDRAQQLVLNSLAAVPGLLLGLALVPTQSTIGLSALITTFLLQTATCTCADTWLALVPAESNRVSTSSPASAVAEQECSHEVVESVEFAEPPLEPSSLGVEETPFALEADPTADECCHESDLPHPSVDPKVVQWMTRSELDGADTCEGAIKVRFAPRAKQVAIHLPFVPPFVTIPTFEAEPLDDLDVEITATSTHGYGIRLEVTRKGPFDQAIDVSIGYAASAPLTALRAA